MAARHFLPTFIAGSRSIMRETTEILIIGGGPGGLACATLLARHGARVILAERKPKIGPKVCAGGITWSGLIKYVPPSLIEREFPSQHIYTRHQQVTLREKNPIIATVSRERLGQWMADQALSAGVRILTGTRATTLENRRTTLTDANGRQMVIEHEHLVGADGSNSLVRRRLGLPSEKRGLGLNCMLPHRHDRMEWHMQTDVFGSGYGWIFPHGEKLSIGAYGDCGNLPVSVLKERLLAWSANQAIPIPVETLQAGFVNADYRGFEFDRTWLVGDAAGLASGLTGEGIYPAMISGQAVARKIIDPSYPAREVAKNG